MIGTVLAVGPQCWKAHAASVAEFVGGSDPAATGPWCVVGDLIFYNRHAGKFMFDPMLPDMKETYVINDDDVIAVLPPFADWTVDILDVMTY